MALILKSIDTMKASRDSNSWTNAQKIEHINALNVHMPDATHFAIASYADNFGYQSVAYIKEWFDAVHAVGKKVLYRPAWGGLSGTLEQRTDHVQEALADLESCWADGDAWDVVPESSPTLGGYGGVAGWNTWVRDTITALNADFLALDLDVDCTFWSLTDTHLRSNAHVEADTVTACGNKVCIDFYPMDAGWMRLKIQSIIGQLGTIHTNYPSADIYITETGYNNTTTVSDEDQRNVLRHFFNELSNLSYVKGLNYWHGYGNSAFDKCLIWQSQSRTLPRPATPILNEKYKNGNCTSRIKILP